MKGADMLAGEFSLFLNPLNAELNPICHLLAVVRTHHILHFGSIRVKAFGLNSHPVPHFNSI
jgi:transposase